MSSLGPLGPFGQVVSQGIGMGAGRALEPPVQSLANEAWRRFQDQPLDPVLLAQGVAQGQVDRDWAAAEATNLGVNAERFGRLVQIADTGPGVATAFQLWRRGVIDAAGFRRAAKREGLEDEWIDDLTQLREVLLSSDELAMMQQQGFIDAARANAEAAKQGVTAERQQLRFQTSGLPPGIETAFELLRRSIIDRDTFAQIVREGHTKTKYTDELLALERRVLSAAEYAGLHLRGWISEAEMNAGGALTGYDAEAMQQLFLNRGRPMSPTQAYVAWARGAPGPYGGVFGEDDFKKVIAQSDVRPEYADVLWHDRFNYPSLFQLRGAVQSGGLTPARALVIMRYQRFEDQDAQAIVASWAKAKSGAARDLTQSQLATEYEGHRITEAQYRDALTKLGYDAEEVNMLEALSEARVVAAQKDALVTALRTRYLAHKLTEDEVRGALTALGITAEGVAQIVPEWTIVREAARATLTAAQIRAAYRKTTIDRATALADLEALGYSEADANTYLDS
jgi:hypothetical protein